jgi:mono/diheme cytochrome c family protein
MTWFVDRHGFVSSLIQLFAIMLMVSPVALAGEPNASASIAFNRDIRPILSDNCFACHGPDKNKREADLRLDTSEGLTGSDDSVGTVVPGKPDESEFFARITSRDPEALMPPPDTGKSLTPQQIAILRQWIEQGAEYQGHWAFQPLTAATATANINDAEASARIDQSIHQELADQGLEPSVEADRVTLLRRLHFDLIGLPPSEAEVSAFLADSSPDAYERQVDRLLQSPHFGERMAMWWLDLVRYADSVGYHGDQSVSVSPFRQYVIDSFNANKPFDQFTLEQIGGDLLPEATREQQIASGYNRLGMMSAEGGVQDKEYLAKYIAERVRNVSGTWLGVTLGCAECHDHKFDPFTTRDFYRFEAFFADIQERGLYAGANKDGSWGTSIKVPTPDQEAELARLDQQIADVRKVLDSPTPELAAAQEAWEKSQTPWVTLEPESTTSQQAVTLTKQSDGSILAGGSSPATDTYSVVIKQLPPSITAFRLEVLPDDSLPQRGPGRAGNGNFVLTEFAAQVKSSSEKDLPVKLMNPSATFEQTEAAGANPYKKWSIESAVDGDEKGVTWGWAVMGKVGQPHSAIFETKDDLTLEEGQVLAISLIQNHENPQHTIGRFRLSVTTAPRPLRVADSPPDAIAAILAIPEAERNDTQRAELATFYLAIAPLLEPQRQQLASLEKSRAELDSQIPTTLVTAAVEPRMVRVLPRGNWMDDSGEIVTPAFPESLAAAPSAPAPSASLPSASLPSTEVRLNRLDLAKWLVSPENPLTARTTVNRIWKLCFGAGLSRKLDDMGAQGEWPSHPELLDFLADRFRANGWDVKRLIKTIVMTHAYRRSSLPAAQHIEDDPYNRWLARQGRFRLDAEVVRDNALSISGLLVPTIGGRSVYPYQPPGYWAYLNFPQREWQDGSGDDLYRRGLYTHWQRQYLHPSLLAFDAPSREECTADRPRSNTPIQSLVLLNDPTYVEAAKSFAEYLVRLEGGVPEKLNAAYLRAVSRPIQPDEQSVLESLLQQHLREYQADPAAAKELLSVGARPVPEDLAPELHAAWTSVARVILNLHEVVTRN